MTTQPEKIIYGPVITEKSLVAQDKGVFTFWVNPVATKSQIASAFQVVFGQKPLAVNTLRLKGKLKTDWKKRLPIQKSTRKKAIITLPKDTKIELLKLATK
ncbi:50S ribosomal protein L23 [Candidatus Shapirobacteria bacterium]|nr:50S ribosomal protein L23 [Candidatus Shapirobacteria bacterium]